MQGEYKSAENYFYQALNKDANPVPDYFALASLYIETNQLQKAKDILQKIPIDEGINRYVVYWNLYEIAKLEGKFEQALNYLEQYTEINDSLSIASNESKILEIENRYKHQKLMTENAELRLKQTGYLLAFAVCLIVVLAMLWNTSATASGQKRNSCCNKPTCAIHATACWNCPSRWSGKTPC
ncbi:tetratricopeptide repeat protein [Bacteroides gallinaceum]|uniref:tetratricopeptide repeat protein n=1 Tax=Bacteroides gallinaceum TaxID=1462571 RepID=UPI0025AAB1DF|nr:tetratricopeptide repeat protein [Bacteroides gallinaceum]MDN0078624.1 tetratricopeptide repeat protein [Bacteroides gallinaceum]